MCKECNNTFCVCGCPNYTDFVPGLGHSRHTCAACEGGIYDGEFYYSISGEIYCEDCVEYFSLRELSSLLGFGDVSNMIETLGGKYRRD